MKKILILILLTSFANLGYSQTRGGGLGNDTVYTYIASDQYHCPNIDTTQIINSHTNNPHWNWDTAKYPNVSFSSLTTSNPFVYNLPHDTCFVCYVTIGMLPPLTVYVVRICNNSSNAGVTNLNWCVSDSTQQQQIYGINPDTTAWWSIANGTATFTNDTLYNTYITDYRANAYINKYVWNVLGCNGDTLRDTLKAEVIRLNRQFITPTIEDTICQKEITYTFSPYPSHYYNFYYFDGDVNHSIVLVNDSTVTFNLVNEGTGYAEVSMNYKGCASYIAQFHTTNARPSAEPNAGQDQFLCQDHTVLDANPYQAWYEEYWTINSGNVSFSMSLTARDTISNIQNGANELVWNVVSKIDSNCIVKDTVIIYNNMPTLPQAGSDSTICLNQILLNANTPTIGTGSWSIVNGGGNIDTIANAVTNINNLAQGVNTLRWTTTNLNCIFYDDVVIINDLPDNPNAGYNSIICDDYATLSANNINIGNGYWTTISGNITYVDSLNPHSQIMNISIDTNILAWNAINNACSLSDTIIITNNKPTVPLAGTDTIMCSNTLLLNANTATQGIGEWSFVNGSGFMTDINNSTTDASGLQQGINTLRWTITKHNCTLYDDIVVLNSLPSEPFAGYNKTICSDSLLLEGSQPSIGNGYWSMVTGNAVFADTTNPHSLIWDISNGTNIIIYTTEKASCQLHDTIIITNNTPTQAIVAIDTAICSDKYILQGNTPSIGEGLWSSTNDECIINKSDSSVTDVTNLSQGANVFIWTITNKGCSNSDKLIVTNNLPDNPNAGGVIKSCDNNASLIANSPVIGNGIWSSINDSVVFSSINNANASISNLPIGKTLVIWTTNNHKCTLTDTATIYSSQMTINTTSKNITGYGKNDGEIVVDVNTGIAPYTFDWNGDEGILNYISNNLQNLPADTYIITVTDSIGCMKSDTIHISDDRYLHIYNTFTPNADGSNDTWEIENLSSYNSAIVKVFNQWGNIVFESNGIYTPWDGTYNGKILPTGSYYYVIDLGYEGMKTKFTGSVLILR